MKCSAVNLIWIIKLNDPPSGLCQKLLTATLSVEVDPSRTGNGPSGKNQTANSAPELAQDQSRQAEFQKHATHGRPNSDNLDLADQEIDQLCATAKPLSEVRQEAVRSRTSTVPGMS